MNSDERLKAWQRAKNILCIRLDSLGDVLMTTPAIRAIKDTNPACHITLLTSQSGAAISTMIPEIDNTIVYDPPWMKASVPPTSSVAEFQMIEHLRDHKFDAAVIFTTFSQSPLPAALLAFMAEIPLRLAYCRENPYYLLTDWEHETDQADHIHIRHEVRRHLDLVASIGCKTANQHLSLDVPAKSFELLYALLAKIGLDLKGPWVVLHPGATAASRRYPAESFAEVAQELAGHLGFQVLFTGNETEIALVEEIRAMMDTYSFTLAGRLRIEEFSALLAMAPLLITNNTGPAHIAAAVRTPVVVLYALTNPQHTPWNVPNRVLYQDVPCKYCYKSVCPMGHHNCLRLVPSVAVVSAALNLLHQSAPA